MKTNIEQWDVEDECFWKSTGSKIANRNLWFSIPALLLAFAVWIMWGVIIKYMKDFGYNFGLTNGLTPGSAEFNKALAEVNNLYYTLPAIAGLAGATLRLPNAFLVSLGGGRNVIFVTTTLLLIPVIGTGMALGNIDTPYLTFAIMAMLSGFGGGNFSSSMSNISCFFPKKNQGYALGMNAGIGNLGVAVMQKLIPFVIGFSLFKVTGVSNVVAGSGPLAGIQNAGWIWVPLLIISVIISFVGMHCVITGTPKLPSTAEGVKKTLYMVTLGVIASALGSYLLIGVKMNMWLVLPIVIIATVLLMKYATPGEIKANLNKQFSILSSKHNWIMTVIYTMTFGSFIGFSAAFPKLCQDIFVYTNHADPNFINPNAPDFMLWVFIGPMLGALARPLGGIISDKVNSGAKITAISTFVQIAGALAVAYFIIQAKQSATPEEYWWPFFGCFMLLFIATGIGNGSTFRSIPYIFNKEQAGPVLGWTAAIAAYGAFIIPKVFGEQIKAGTPEYAFYGFTAYYVICLFLNWWYYQGPKREFNNP